MSLVLPGSLETTRASFTRPDRPSIAQNDDVEDDPLSPWYSCHVTTARDNPNGKWVLGCSARKAIQNHVSIQRHVGVPCVGYNLGLRPRGESKTSQFRIPSPVPRSLGLVIPRITWRTCAGRRKEKEVWRRLVRAHLRQCLYLHPRWPHHPHPRSTTSTSSATDLGYVVVSGEQDRTLTPARAQTDASTLDSDTFSETSTLVSPFHIRPW